MLAIVNFHYIRNNFNAKYSSIFGLTPKQFENQILELAKWGTFISQRDLKAAVKNQIPLPDKAILLTFDDGLAEQYNFALPILKALKVPAVFFINSQILVQAKILNVHKIHLLRSTMEPRFFLEKLLGFIKKENIEIDTQQAALIGKAHYKNDNEIGSHTKYLLNFSISILHQNHFIESLFSETFQNKEENIFHQLYMTQEQIKNLASLGYIGSHGHNHLPIALLNKEERHFQLSTSKKILQDVTGKEIYGFSFPYGAYEACNISAESMRLAGYEYGVTLERLINHNVHTPHHLARMDCVDAPTGKNHKFSNNNLFENFSSPKWKFN